MPTTIEFFNELLTNMIHEKNEEKRAILQKNILQYSKSIKLQNMNQLGLDAQILICSWTYRYLWAISTLKITEKEKKHPSKTSRNHLFFSR